MLRSKPPILISAIMTLGFAWFAPSRAAAQRLTEAQAKSVLDRIEKRYNTLKSLSENTKGKIEIVGAGGSLFANISSTIRLLRPNRFRIDTTVEYFAKEFHSSVISDGSKLWEWDPDNKRYSENPISKMPRSATELGSWMMQRGGMDLSMLMFLEGSKQSKSGPSERPPLKGVTSRTVNGRLEYVINMSGLVFPGGKGTFTASFDGKDLLVRKTQANTPFPKKLSKGLALTIKLNIENSEVIPNDEFLDEIFTFHPPDDARIASNLKPVLTRATEIEADNEPPLRTPPDKPEPPPSGLE